MKRTRWNMEILVYGAGVIGSYLTHVLCGAGHEVTLVARGKRRDELAQNGLRIRHHLQRKTTVDHPRIVERPDPEACYDAAFAVMQYQQMWSVLGELAACSAPLVVLVGNNPSAPEMERFIHERSGAPKTVLFGFQATGGSRAGGGTVCVRAGAAGLTYGPAHRPPDGDGGAKLAGIFSCVRYKLDEVPDMDAWYQCHLALVLPVGYLCYATGCDLRKSTRPQRGQVIAAAREGFGLLRALGYPIVPEGSEAYFGRGPKRICMSAVFWLMAKTAIGRLAASEHCRNAVAEMQELDGAFRALRAQKPDFPMPAWGELEQHLPQKEDKVKIDPF